MLADLQLQLGHIKSQKEKITALAGDLKRLRGENSRLEPKLLAIQKKKESLERDLLRLQEMERAMDFDVDLKILRDLDNRMEMDTLTSTEYQEKMEKLLAVMSELLTRTVANYKTACLEKEDQEEDFKQRVSDAIQARNMLTEEVFKIQSTVEETMEERIKEYEIVQQLEKNISIIDAEIWLTRADSHRIADQLALVSTKPTTLPCRERERIEEPIIQKTLQIEKKITETDKEFDDLLPQIIQMLPQNGQIFKEKVPRYLQVVEEISQENRVSQPSGEEGHIPIGNLSQILKKGRLGTLIHSSQPPAQNEGIVRVASRLSQQSSIRASISQPSDLTEIVRAALQMFDIELE